MGLLIYESPNANTAFSVGSSFSNPVHHAVDGARGGTVVKRYYVRNDDSAFTYSNITVEPVRTSGVNVVDSLGFSFKLIVGDSQPTEAQWAVTTAGAEIDIPDITSSTTYQPFWLRIQVPPNISATSYEGIKLRITAAETLVQQMTKILDEEDRDLLEFRPRIEFVEPPAERGVITPQAIPIQLEDIQAERQRVKQMARAVEVLATATQARLDDKAKNLTIRLDRLADQDAIQAMRRHFPGQDPNVITYEQWRKCQDEIRARGLEIARQALFTPEEIRAAGDAAQSGNFAIGGYGTLETNSGALRPEVDRRSIIIPPINIEEMQIDLICILVNFIWKNFIKPIFRGIAIPPPFGPSIADLLPDQLCDPGIDLDIPGLFILGNRVPDLLLGKTALEAARDAGIID